ncbi:MAG: SAM-dependent chlorinase/fluorinase [Actinobacteria bacterium]|nr:SAM-dependent chlorinase/fluorinase [Actinomycetota bacterium]
MTLPVSFLSDFGHDDEFVGVVHGVLAKLAPGSRVIDIGHGFPPGNVRASALALVRAIQYLPEGVCLAVVDPGVGSARKALALRSDWGFFVGPDNGLLSPAVALTGGAHEIVSIENPEAMIPSPGDTFQGRDVFAPAAALLASGEATLDDLGPRLDGDEVVPLLLPLAEVDDGRVTGEVWWIDRFGNAQTNLSPEDLTAAGLSPGDTAVLRLGSAIHNLPWARNYSEVGEGEGLIHIDSAGLVAIAVRSGRADDVFGIAIGVSVTLTSG